MSPPADDPATAAIVSRLDRLIALFQLAHSGELAQTRARIRSDVGSAVILDLAEDGWIAAGKLRDAAEAKTKLKSTAISDRIAELVGMGALEKTGGGPTTRYRSTGIL